MYTNNCNTDSKITVEDMLKAIEQMKTHYCFVHDEELKLRLEKAGIPELDIKVSKYVEKGTAILVEKSALWQYNQYIE